MRLGSASGGAPPPMTGARCRIHDRAARAAPVRGPRRLRARTALASSPSPDWGIHFARAREYLTAQESTGEDQRRLPSAASIASVCRCVSYSDPFGLCVDKDVNCQNLVRMLREQKGSEFHAAADRYDAQKTGRVFFYSRQQNTSNRDAYNVDGDPGTYQLGNTRGTGGDVFLRGDVSTSDFLLTAVHESGHLAGDGGETGPTHAAWRAYNQLSPGARSSAIFNANIFFKLWGTGYGAPLPAGTKESRDRQVYFVPSP
jgi:hypothetical protein